MKREKGIIAYGTELDRQKLAALASITNRSASEWMIMKIREEYAEVFRDAAPHCVMPQQS